jgi:UDP-N-acetylglucosamine 2-epimerase (non-hydrolysing)
MHLLLNVVGARPQFVKAGPVSRALAAAGVEELLVDTGQHYDSLLSEEIMRDIGLRRPDVNLGVGSGSHSEQTAGILQGLEEVILARKPFAVLTYGDTNSTIATALTAVKEGIPTAHVEAGLRSFNRDMPEEVNRVVTDRISDLLFAPTQRALINLEAEGLANRALLTGDVMVDALNSIDLSAVELPTWAKPPFFLATIHRAGNTDDPARLGSIIRSLQGLDRPVHLLAHPRLMARLDEFAIHADLNALHVHEPLSYAPMLATLAVSRCLFTDSGGLQKEAFILGTPCVTLRSETEWPETLEGGWNVLVEPDGMPPELAHRTPSQRDDQPFGDGRAAERIVRSLIERL